jgi:Domain of unknown function (DUF5655)
MGFHQGHVDPAQDTPLQMIECPVCGRPLKHATQWHDCVRTTIDGLLDGRSPELILAFDTLLAAVAEWPDLVISRSTRCVIFSRKHAFLVVKPMRTELDLKCFAAEPVVAEWVRKNTKHGPNYEVDVRIRRAEDVTPTLLRIIRTSHAQK